MYVFILDFILLSFTFICRWEIINAFAPRPEILQILKRKYNNEKRIFFSRYAVIRNEVVKIYFFYLFKYYYTNSNMKTYA